MYGQTVEVRVLQDSRGRTLPAIQTAPHWKPFHRLQSHERPWTQISHVAQQLTYETVERSSVIESSSFCAELLERLPDLADRIAAEMPHERTGDLRELAGMILWFHLAVEKHRTWRVKDTRTGAKRYRLIDA